jgi:hypothetical protein
MNKSLHFKLPNSALLAATVLVISALITLVGCSRTLITPIGKERTYTRFDRRIEPENIGLFMGKLDDREYIEIAYVDSKAVIEQTAEAGQKQLEELQRLASNIGAHAVHGIHTEEMKIKGPVWDRRVPVYAWKHGYYDMKFLRGVAVRFTDWEDTREIPNTKTKFIRKPLLNNNYSTGESFSPIPGSNFMTDSEF